jgi:hypothetical protein
MKVSCTVLETMMVSGGRSVDKESAKGKVRRCLRRGSWVLASSWNDSDFACGEHDLVGHTVANLQ